MIYGAFSIDSSLNREQIQTQLKEIQGAAPYLELGATYSFRNWRISEQGCLMTIAGDKSLFWRRIRIRFVESLAGFRLDFKIKYPNYLLIPVWILALLLTLALFPRQVDPSQNISFWKEWGYFSIALIFALYMPWKGFRIRKELELPIRQLFAAYGIGSIPEDLTLEKADFIHPLFKNNSELQEEREREFRDYLEAVSQKE